MQRSALCRSRRELSNAYFVAKFGLDTAENEPCQVCPIPRNAARNEHLQLRRGRRERPRKGRSGKLDRARSRLYRSQILQENMRWKALAEIYTMHSFAPFWNRMMIQIPKTMKTMHRSLSSSFCLKIAKICQFFLQKFAKFAK